MFSAILYGERSRPSSVHTDAILVHVYWYVVGGEYELGVYADGRSYSCACWSVHSCWVSDMEF